jgi:putative nucleotidyltransferase with HDIG domain
MIFPHGSLSFRLLSRVHAFAKRNNIKLYLVGGVLRDALIGRQKANPDIDFCLKRQAIALGRKLSRLLAAGFVVLDRPRGYCRLVKKVQDAVYTLDFTDFRGVSLTDDLRMRDFTINAMALELPEALRAGDFKKDIIDPYGGLGDIGEQVIRIVDTNNFRDDPLRILRAFSLAAIFGFRIEKKTLLLARRDRERLRGVSAERIRDELFKILAQPSSAASLDSLDALGILKFVLPECEVMRGIRQGPYHHLNVWKHSLETVRQLERLMGELAGDTQINAYLDEAIGAWRSRRALMKLGALLHDIGKPQAKKKRGKKTIFHGHERIGADLADQVCRRLKLSNDEISALRKMVFWHLRPGYLGDSVRVSARAKFRYFRDAGSEGVSTLLVSIADQRSTRGPLTSKNDRLQHERICFGLIRDYFRSLNEAKPHPLVNGDMLMKKFRLTPSPLIGKILMELKELQAIGKVKTRLQAWEAAGKIVRQSHA